ncbi:MAG: transcription initiation factor IIE [Clostridia bacterium]|nr:transcription initiation factor IIE [Clostridia bacterium]
MKYQESNACAKNELGANVKRIISDLLAERLVVEGQHVKFPDDVDLEVKVKFAVDEEGGTLTIKIGWDNYVEEAVEEEESF